MLEPTISLAIVLITMALMLFLLAFSSQQNSVYRSFFFIVAIWFLFLNLTASRHSLDIVERINMTKFVYNGSGGLSDQQNTTQTNDANIPASMATILDTTHFTWLWIAILLTTLEVIHLIIMTLSFFRGKKNGDQIENAF